MSIASAQAIRGWLGPSAPRAPRIAQDLWNIHKETIIQLYETETLQKVREFMLENHGFQATTRQYVAQLEKWNIWKLDRRRRAADGSIMKQTSTGNASKREHEPGEASSHGQEGARKRIKYSQLPTANGTAEASGSASAPSFSTTTNFQETVVIEPSPQATPRLLSHLEDLLEGHILQPSHMIATSRDFIAKPAHGFSSDLSIRGLQIATELLTAIQQPTASFKLQACILDQFQPPMWTHSVHGNRLHKVLTAGLSAVTASHCTVIESHLKPFLDSTSDLAPSERFLANNVLSKCASARKDERERALYLDLANLCGDPFDLFESISEDRCLQILFYQCSSQPEYERHRFDMETHLRTQDKTQKIRCVRSCLHWCHQRAAMSYSSLAGDTERTDWGNAVLVFKWMWDELSRSPPGTSYACDWYASAYDTLGITPALLLMSISRHVTSIRYVRPDVPSEHLVPRIKELLSMGGESLLEITLEYIRTSLNPGQTLERHEATLKHFPELANFDSRPERADLSKSRFIDRVIQKQRPEHHGRQGYHESESLCRDTLISSLSSQELTTLRSIHRRLKLATLEASKSEKLKRPSSVMTLSSYDGIATIVSSLSSLSFSSKKSVDLGLK